MRRFISALLASLLLVGMVPVTAGAAVGTVTVSTAGELAAAVADPSVTEIDFAANILTTAQLSVDRAVLVDGKGFSLTVSADLGSAEASKYALLLRAGAAGEPITVQNLTIDSASKAYGVEATGSAVAVLDNVTLVNSKGAGLTVNGSTVTASGLITSGNSSCAVKVDPGAGVTAPSVFTLLSGSLSEAIKIWSDGVNVTSTATVTVNAADAGFQPVPTGTRARIWTVPRTVAAPDAAALIAAIHDLQPGDTVVLSPGTYDVQRLLGDMIFGGQPGWYMPVWQPGVTIRGAGSSLTTVTSSVVSMNGVWATQDMMSVWANNVTIEGFTLVPKTETNKAIEVFGKDFTARDVRILTNPAGPEPGVAYYEFGGSVYFLPLNTVTGSGTDVGSARLENVFIESAGIGARTSDVTTGTITLSDVTIDWIDAAIAWQGWGPMSANPVIVVEDDLLVIVDDKVLDYATQVTSRMPPGATLEIRGVPDALPGVVFTSLRRGGVYPPGGTMSLSSAATATTGGPLYTWTFPVGSIDPSFVTTFYPGVTVQRSLSTPMRYGAAGLTLSFSHPGDLPGPASIRFFAGEEFAGKTFTDAFLGELLFEGVVDADGYLTVSVTTSDKMYLVERRQFAVSFDSNGGSSVPGQTVLEGSCAATPTPEPTKQGYRFVGWYADSGLKDPWDFSADQVTGATTLYASYVAEAPLTPVVTNAKFSNPIAYQLKSLLTTRFTCNVDVSGATGRLDIVDGNGVVVKTIYNGAMVAGANTLPTWNGMDAGGKRLFTSAWTWRLTVSKGGLTTTVTGKIPVSKIYFSVAGTATSAQSYIRYMMPGNANIYVQATTANAADSLSISCYETKGRLIGTLSYALTSAATLNATAYYRDATVVRERGDHTLRVTPRTGVSYSILVIQ